MAIGPTLWGAWQSGPDQHSRRWPIFLFGASMVLFLGPLGVDLFLAIPWPVRRGMGQGLVLVSLGAGLIRLWQVRAGDAWPAMQPGQPLTCDQRGPADPTRDLLPWLLQLVVGSFVFPLLREPEPLGFGDWDYFLEKFEAIRVSILEYGQFPWWNPWCAGGFPLASDPQCGVVSLATPLVLFLGTSTGLRLAALFSLMIAVEGARRLGYLWFREAWSAAAVALIYGINGAVLVYTVAGYFIPMSYCALPWILVYTFRIGQRLRDGLWLGFWVAVNLLSGIQYPSLHGLILAALIWLRALRVQSAAERGRLLRNTVAALGLVLALAGWRIATTASVMADFPRVMRSAFNASAGNMIDWLLYRPGAQVLEKADSIYFWETASYVGPLVLLLAIGSLIRGWRWWHALTFATLWLASGSMYWYHPSFWLAYGPLFSTMHVVPRWRILTMLGLGLSVGSLIAEWRAQESLLKRTLAVVCVLVLASDLVSYGFQVLPVASSVVAEENRFPALRTSKLVNLHAGQGYPAILRNYGVIQGYQPLLGYDRQRATHRLWRGAEGYRGEAWTVEAGPLEPRFWSPNRIVFQAKPGQTVHLNQNPGSWWLVNGRRAFPAWRCAELLRPFEAQADSAGNLVLQIAPRGDTKGWALHALGLALVIGSTRRRRSHSSAG